MADNRIAYGLLKSMGVDTTGWTPKQAWEYLKKHGITPENAYQKQYDFDVNDRIKWAKRNGIELPLNADGSLDDLKLQELYNKSTKKKMTPAEKIASVHIDFDKDNILPELNDEDLEKVGSKVNKPVLLKKGVIDRNAKRHIDAMPDTELILKNALYAPSEVFKGNKDKPYYTFVKAMKISNRNGLDEYGIVLLDVDEKKDDFEIVHWHWVNEDNINKLKK